MYFTSFHSSSNHNFASSIGINPHLFHRTLTFYSIFLFILFTFKINAQTYTANPNAAIIDDASTLYPLTVSGLLPGQIDTTFFGVEQVCIDLSHTWDSDLNIYLIAPDGTTVSLSLGQGGSDDNYTNTCFDPSAAQSITQGTAPFTGLFRPMGQLGLVNNTQNPNGQWNLRIDDTYPADDGTLFSFSITFGNSPASYFSISESDLPIFRINTNGQIIPDEPRIGADMQIIWNGFGNRNHLNDPPNHYNGRIGIETRGASSSGFPKRSYRFELWNQNNEDIDSSLIGMPADSDWILSAQYSDKTLIRGMLTFDLIRRMGWYAPRVQPVELILNDEYLGVYLLMEKVKRHDERIDIAKLDTNELSGDELTGGYIIKLDKNSGQSAPGWTSSYDPWPSGSSIEFSYDYPDADAIALQQQHYIKTFIDSFETALAGPDFTDSIIGYRRFVNIESCVDAFIVQEFSKSIDSYRKSFFMYKDKNSNGGKLVMAPIWDYDLSYGNCDFCEGQNYFGWQYNFNYICGGDYWLNPFWFERMTQDSLFNNLVRCRWDELRNDVLNNDRINAWIDSVADYMHESQAWNFAVWPILGTYVWPNYYIGQTWQEELDTLKWWMQFRSLFMELYLPGNADNCNNLASLNRKETTDPSLHTWPNPTCGTLRLSVFLQDACTLTTLIYAANGSIITTSSIPGFLGTNKFELSDFNELIPGIYLLEIRASEKVWRKRIIKGFADN